MKKGFTLVELLVILIFMGIILLFIFPNVTNIMKKNDDNRKKAFLNDLFLATEAYVQKNIDDCPNLEIDNGQCLIAVQSLINSRYLRSNLINPETNEKLNGSDYKVVVTKQEDEGYKYELVKGEYTLNDVSKYEVKENGTSIYYDPVNNLVCDNYTEENSATGKKDGCMKWYVFLDDKKNSKVNLILDHNTTATIAWANKEDYVANGGKESDYGTSGNNNKGPLTLNKQLKNDTENWKLSARIISANEIAKITGADIDLQWDESKPMGKTIGEQSGWYNVNGANVKEKNYESYRKNETSVNPWLYDRTGIDCKSYRCLNNSTGAKTEGYWTSSPIIGVKEWAWRITKAGNLDNNSGISVNTKDGVRPVITVSKDIVY